MTKGHYGKVLRWLVTAVLVLALSGCGVNQPVENGPSSGNGSIPGETTVVDNKYPGPPKAEKPIPAFELADRGGRTVKVPEGFAGRALYLVFFSTG